MPIPAAARRAVPALLLALALAGCQEAVRDPDGTIATPSATPAAPDPVPGGKSVALAEVAAGLVRPVAFAQHPVTGSLLVAEQQGRILDLGNGTAPPTTWLDLVPQVGSDGNEQGLLGFAFHPDFAQNGVLVLSYTDTAGDSVLSRIVVPPGNGTPDLAQEEVLLLVDQPFSNHNGGHVAWGPDGHLYFGLGDGGSANDPLLNGQNRATLLGSLLRLDVGGSGPYTVPADNPFVGQQGARGETWAYGLRNPWRFHFDSSSGDLWIGDVGQNVWEEVNHQPASSAGGENYGWNLFEGNHPSGTSVDVGAPGYTFPVAEYGHGGGHCSVTMGPVVRDPRLNGTAVVGRAILADYCSGRFWTVSPAGDLQELWDEDVMPSSFGEGLDGTVYVLDHNGGRLLRLEAAPSP